jgi:hypothetical protein
MAPPDANLLNRSQTFPRAALTAIGEYEPRRAAVQAKALEAPDGPE